MATKRRTRTDHPGVYIKPRTLPSGETAWRARYLDPDTGKTAYTTLPREAARSRETRRLFAVNKSRALQQRRAELAGGAERKAETDFATAVDAYLKSARNRLQDSTLRTYTAGIHHLRTWAAKEGVRHCEQLTPARLRAYREWLVAEGKRAPAKNSARGGHRATNSRRSAITVNSYMTASKIVLNHLRGLGYAPGLTKDAIGDALKPLSVVLETPDYLTSTQIRRLLEAAQRHDEATFKATRAEHAGLVRPGSTRRHTPIAPFLAFLLLSGCRRGEALGLRWRDLDLGAEDSEGRVVGEIRLKGATTKTKRARLIGLEVSPALRALLSRLKLGVRSDDHHVFGGEAPYTEDVIDRARKRLCQEYGAPTFTWQQCRQTCATYLVCSSGIFGNATVYLAAKQLGHSVEVAQRHYLGVLRGVPQTAKTLEAAMGIEAQLAEIAPKSVQATKGKTA